MPSAVQGKREGGQLHCQAPQAATCPLSACLTLPWHSTLGMAPQQRVSSHHPHCSPEARPVDKHRGRSLQGSGLGF